MNDCESPNDLNQSKVHFNLKQNVYDEASMPHMSDSKEGSLHTTSRLSSRLSQHHQKVESSSSLAAAAAMTLPDDEEVHDVKLVVNIVASFPTGNLMKIKVSRG